MGNLSLNNRRARRVFVAGGTGFLGYRVVRALLDNGAEVTVLVRPDSEEKLGPLAREVRVISGDPWNPGSLRGRARGHNVVIHLIGGLKPNPQRGLTFRHLNFVSTRNVAQMAVNDGVNHFIFLSAARVFGLPSGYLESKREAERYLQKSGLNWTILYAPPLSIPGARISLGGAAARLLSLVPIVGGVFNAQVPLSADTAARAIAYIATTGDLGRDRTVAPALLRRIGRLAERQFIRQVVQPPPASPEDDEPPFGWLP